MIVVKTDLRESKRPERWLTLPSDTKRYCLALSVLILVACGEGNDIQTGAVSDPGVSAALPGSVADAAAGSTTDQITGVIAQGALLSLTDADLSAMTAVEQYRIANRLVSTLYSGIAVDDFFDYDNSVSGSFDTVAEAFRGQWFSDLRVAMQTPLPLAERLRYDLQILGSEELDYADSGEIAAAYEFSRDRPRELPLARIYHYPNSLDKSSQWMAWHLANSILFSPSADLESAGMTDVQNVMRRLDKAIMADMSIRDVVFEHMRSEQNWRRFRSPEDNTREMLEIYLGFEDLDDEVPAASIACQDLYLTEERDGYQLAYTDFPNSQSQTVLGQSVVTCDDFYRLVANHEQLIPHVSRILVSYFFSSRSVEFKQEAVAALVSLGATTFRELFMSIVFSRAYLLETEKVKSFEENFLSTAQRIHWRPRDDMFIGLATGWGGLNRAFMQEMSWPSMTHKLGRAPVVPTDSLSFANYHKALREELLMNAWRWNLELGLQEPEPPEPAPPSPLLQGASTQALANYQTALAENQQLIDAMSKAEQDEYHLELAEYQLQLSRFDVVKTFNIPQFIDYLFVSVAMRKAHSFETEKLVELFHLQDWIRFEEEGRYLNKWNRTDAARLVFDYLSRLSETYYHRAAGGIAE